MVERVSTGEVAQPTLSVVLPNYNHARYLPRALDALLAQKVPNTEIIVVDDFSLDDSRELIALYAAKNPSIRLIANHENLGVIATLSIGLRAAKGRFIYFGAADDFVTPGFFDRAVTALEAHPRAGLYCGEAITLDGNSGQPLGVRPMMRPRFTAGFIEPHQVARLLRGIDNFILTGAAVFRCDAIVWAGGFDERLSSFADGYAARKVALAYGFYYAPLVVLTWCIHHNSVSRKTSTELDRALKVLAAIRDRLSHDLVFPRWYADAFERRWRFLTCRLAIEMEPVNRELLLQMGGRRPFDRRIIKLALKISQPSVSRFLLLAWLWLRLRPFSLFGIALTSLVRIWARARRDAKNTADSQR